MVALVNHNILEILKVFGDVTDWQCEIWWIWFAIECSRLVVCDYELVCEHCDGWIQVWVCYELVCVTGEYKYECAMS